MNISVLGFIFIFFICSGSIYSSSLIPREEPDTTSGTSDAGPLFSRECRIITDPSNSSVIMVLNLLYSIPSFQETFYAEADAILSACDHRKARKNLLKNSLVVATAAVFTHMRMGQEPISLDTYFYEACQKAFGKPIKNVLMMKSQFLKSFFDKMPLRISSLYKHQSRISFFKFPSFSFIGKITKELKIGRFPLGGKEISLENYIKKNFFEPSFSCIGPDGTTFAGIKVTTSEEFLETPEILFFDVPRLKPIPRSRYALDMNRENIYFEKEITINLVKYFLIGYSPFNQETNNYSLFTRDFGDMGIYEIIDGNVVGIFSDSAMTTFMNDNTILLVYVRSETLNRFDRERIKTFADIPNSVKQLNFADHIEEVDSEDSILDLIATDFSSENSSDSFKAPVAESVYSGFTINPETKLILPKMNSFISSLFTAFYNIPDFQRAIYNDAVEYLSGNRNKKGISTKIAIAAVFAQMRLNVGTAEHVTDYLLEAISKESKTSSSGTFGHLSSFVQKSPSFLGRNYRKNIKIDCESKFLDAADSKPVGAALRRSIFIVPLQISEHSPLSVSYYARNNFEEPRQSSAAYKVSDTSTKVYLSNEIHKSSNYLFLDIIRIHSNRNVEEVSAEENFHFDRNPIFIDSEIIINEINYILVSRVEFDADNMTYFTISKDFHTSFAYKFSYDGTVQALQDAEFADFADNATTLLIYAEKSNFYNSYISAIEIPEIIKPILQQIEEEGQRLKTPLTKRRRIEPAASVITDPMPDSVYRPEYSIYPLQFQDLFKKVEKRILVLKEMNLSEESLNFMSKYYYEVYNLGSEEYSFKVEAASQSLALEVLLVQLAGSVRFVKGLFELVKYQRKQNTLEMGFAIVISRMLLGCKNISYNTLLKEISKKSGKHVDDFRGTNQDHSGLSQQIKTIISQIDFSLIALPAVKKVIYPDLFSNDPSTISRHKISPVSENGFIDPTPADIRGAWFDCEHKISPKRRARKIYSSPAVIFPVEIFRNSINSVNVYASSMDRNADGFICELLTGQDVYSYVLDKFTGKYRALIMGSESVSYDPVNEEFYNLIQTRKLRYSIQLFMTSKDDQVQRVFSNIIPDKVVQLALEQILSETRQNRVNQVL